MRPCDQGILSVSAHCSHLLSTTAVEVRQRLEGFLAGAGLGLSGVCAVPGTQWVLTKCLLLIIKPTLFIRGLSPKTTLYLQSNLNYLLSSILRGQLPLCGLEVEGKAQEGQ